jgi:multiple sugar transport system ATP-binding protein
MADVTLRKVIKRYDEVEAVRGIDLDIADHEFVVLVGPSGCGKSTTLRNHVRIEDQHVPKNRNCQRRPS